MNAFLPAGSDVVRVLPISAGDVVHSVEAVNVFRLFAAAADGSSVPRALTPFVPGRLSDLVLSPDETWLAMGVYSGNGPVHSIHVVPTDGSRLPRRVDGPHVPGGGVPVEQAFAFSPDSRRILYLADQELRFRFELFEATLEKLWRSH